MENGIVSDSITEAHIQNLRISYWCVVCVRITRPRLVGQLHNVTFNSAFAKFELSSKPAILDRRTDMFHFDLSQQH